MDWYALWFVAPLGNPGSATVRNQCLSYEVIFLSIHYTECGTWTRRRILC